MPRVKEIFVAVLVLMNAIIGSEAYERCNDYESDEFFCEDTDSAVAYCCNYYALDYHSCCYATYTWGLWYFWFGIFAGLLFLAAIFTVTYRICCKSNRTTSDRQGQVTTVTSHAVPVSEFDQTMQFKLADAPPSYDNLMEQNMQTKQTSMPTVSTVYQQPYGQYTNNQAVMVGTVQTSTTLTNAS